MTAAGLAALAAFAVALLLVLVLAVRLHAFLALLLTSVAVALLGGIPPAEIAGEVQKAVGDSLGYIAVVIGVGAMFGALLQRSGGAAGVANGLLRALGEERAPWASRRGTRCGRGRWCRRSGVTGFAVVLAISFFL